MKSKTIPIILVLLISAFATLAQTTQFSYQGSLKDGGNPANGNYDFEFFLFGALSGGSQLGPTNTRNAVAVTNGVFSVFLDFGNQFSAGDNRWLEIRTRPTGQPGFTVLTPRQPLTTVPYAWKSQEASSAGIATNAAQLGGVAANQFVQTGDARLSDARSPLPGSGNYIQNQSAAPQPSASFNISGNGTAGGSLSASYVNAETDFRIGSTVLHGNGTDNWAVGFGAGQSITSLGVNSVFFGRDAGWLTTTGSNNTFVGFRAGRLNTTGSESSYFGANSGNVGNGSQNSFFGVGSGNQNTSGFKNTFVGFSSGTTNSTGAWNTLVGNQANVGSGNLNNATAIGNAAYVTQSNSLVLGAINGINGAGASTNVGIGTTAPRERLHVVGGNIFVAQPNSLIITSPNGACWFITVSNGGILSTILGSCP